MISDQVTEDETVVVLEIRDVEGNYHAFECVVDTGFSGLMALSNATVLALSLSQIGEEDVYLAHGRRH